MGNRYLIVSDLHLCDVEDHPDGWMYHKSSRYLFDGPFADLLADFVAREAGRGPLTLVLNGDIFDFDLVRAVPDSPPWPVRRAERKRGLDATEDKSVWKLERILAHHPRFVHALVGFLCGGHRVVYVMGNHDREFHFPAVQQAFFRWLRGCAEDSGGYFAEDAIVIEPWFYVVPGEIYVEHGHQYDSYTTFRYLLAPTVKMRGEEVLAIPMGNLANRYLMTRMGFFNPHNTDYILNLFCYFKHWVKHYAFTRRSLALTWLFGSLAVIFRSLEVTRRQLAHPPSAGRFLSRVARRYGLDPATLRSLHRLQQPPITSRVFRMVRELWMDRVLVVLAVAAGVVTLWASATPLWAKIAATVCLAPAIVVLYEKVTEGETVFSIEERLPRVARAISRLVPVRVVAFGHTHVPRMHPLSRDVTFIDTGAWAPVTRKDRPERLEPGYRDFARIAFDGGEPSIVFDSWLEDARTAWRATGEAAPGTGRAAASSARSNGGGALERYGDFWWVPSHFWEPDPKRTEGTAAPIPRAAGAAGARPALPVSESSHSRLSRTRGSPKLARANTAGSQAASDATAEPWWTPASWLDEGRAAMTERGDGGLPSSVRTAEWDVLLSKAG